MKYSERGKINPFDNYMAGFAPWITPRQIPILVLSPTAPGDLKQVQAWSKVASAKEIEKY